MGIGIGHSGGYQPSNINGSQGSVEFKAKRQLIELHFKQQEALNKTANVKGKVEAQKKGEVPRELFPKVAGKVESADVRSIGLQPDASEVKKQSLSSSSFLTKVLTFVQKTLRAINAKGYIHKLKEQVKATHQKAIQTAYRKTTIPVPPTFIKGTPEQMSAAASKLNEFMLNPANLHHLETVGIFRESPSQSQKISLYNQLMKSPESADLNGVSDPHLLAGAFKQIYKDMNLFGSDSDKAAKFEEIGNKLLVDPKPGEQEIIGFLKELKASLPAGRQIDLKNFIQVLAKASESSEVSKMGFSNLAIAAGPNLCDSMNMEMIKPRQEIAHQFIAHYQKVFEG